MSRILIVEASPMGERSSSLSVADAFDKAYREAHPEDDVDVLNLFEEEIPDFGRAEADAKYALMHGKQVSDDDAAAWRRVEGMIERFKSADKYVLAVPMWNFSIPYKLKQLLDVIIQPGYTFSYDPDSGYKGLLTGKRAFVVYARGGEYTEAAGTASYDMQKPYLETALGFMGITDVTSVVVEPTMSGGPEAAAEKRSAAIDEAVKAAAEF